MGGSGAISMLTAMPTAMVTGKNTSLSMWQLGLVLRVFMAALRRMPLDNAPIESGKPPGVRGGRSEIHDNNVATSGALPGDTTRLVGSLAGILSMTVRRVSAVVPWRA